MPKIIEYDAKQDKLNPSNLGYSAAETAARREGSFYEQMAQGTREVGRLQEDYDKEVGQQITDFLRFKGLEASASNVAIRVASGGRDSRTLIGTGSSGNNNFNAAANASNERYDNGGTTYSHLREAAQGPAYLSRVARQMVQQNSPVWNNEDQTYETQSQVNARQAYWQKYNQAAYDKSAKAGNYGPDPEKEMQQLTGQANDTSDAATKAQADPSYMGPGASLMGPSIPYANPNAVSTDTSAYSPSPETSSDTSNSPSLWRDITNSYSADAASMSM